MAENPTTIELDRAHEWDAGSPWGIIFGVSRCKRCGVLSTVANQNERDCVSVRRQRYGTDDVTRDELDDSNGR